MGVENQKLLLLLKSYFLQKLRATWPTTKIIINVVIGIIKWFLNKTNFIQQILCLIFLHYSGHLWSPITPSNEGSTLDVDIASTSNSTYILIIASLFVIIIGGSTSASTIITSTSTSTSDSRMILRLKVVVILDVRAFSACTHLVILWIIVHILKPQYRSSAVEAGFSVG